LGRDAEGAEKRDAEDVHSNMETRGLGILGGMAPCSPKSAIRLNRTLSNARGSRTSINIFEKVQDKEIATV